MEKKITSIYAGLSGAASAAIEAILSFDDAVDILSVGGGQMERGASCSAPRPIPYARNQRQLWKKKRAARGRCV